MKCESCGNELHIEDEKCPYCGTPNPHYQEHRADMNRYAQDYGRTKSEVLQKTNFFTGYTVKITIIAVLAALELALLLVRSNSWDIIYYFKVREIERNQTEYQRILDEYEQNGDYIAFYAYFSEKNLYSAEEFDEYDKVEEACMSYSYAYNTMMKLVAGSSYMDYEDDIEYICEELEYLYESLEPREYEDESRYSGQHGETLAALKQEVQYLLITYGGLDEETAANFEELSSARKQLALEEGMRQYEKESDF